MPDLSNLTLNHLKNDRCKGHQNMCYLMLPDSDTLGECQNCHYNRGVTVSSHFYYKVNTFEGEKTVTVTSFTVSGQACTGRGVRSATGLGWLRFGMFHHPDGQ